MTKLSQTKKMQASQALSNFEGHHKEIQRGREFVAEYKKQAKTAEEKALKASRENQTLREQLDEFRLK